MWKSNDIGQVHNQSQGFADCVDHDIKREHGNDSDAWKVDY